MITDKLTFHDGRAMPSIGLGVWQIPAADTAHVVSEAIQLGYRLIDGAAIYGNEEGLGEGIRRSHVRREDIFVTSKLWNSEQGYDRTLRAFEASLNRLGLDYLDLYLIHWPAAQRNLYVDTWKALIRLREEGRVRSIGVSNFNESHLQRLIDETGEVPVLNQIEVHPRLQQVGLRGVNQRLNIRTQSWTPLGQSRSFDADPIRSAAERLGKTPAQIILRWHLQLGLSAIPRSVHPQRLAQNIDIFDFALTADDMARIAALNVNERIGPDPEVFS